MGLLINLDNGGTFTDAFVTDGKATVHAKSPTTPHDLTICFVDVLRRASSEFYGEENLERLIREADHLRYSTTSGTNAVVEGKGPPIGLVVDKGCEKQLYGDAGAWAETVPLWKAMSPVPPEGLAVSEAKQVDEAELMALVNRLLGAGVHRIVFCLTDREAEQSAKTLLLRKFPRHLLGAVPVLFSFELSGDRNDARRLSTCLLNAFLHPTMERFLYGAEEVARRHHMRNPLLIFRNDGASARVAKTIALKTYSSGPAGGLAGAAAYAQHYGAPAAISTDIGGTTTDYTVIHEGAARALAYGVAGELPFSFEMGEVESIGAGGSSVLRVSDGVITVGPDSVGAAPGPAAFGRGGTNATLTDVLAYAGVLDPENYLGGSLKLDLDRAEAAIETELAKPLGVSVEEAAIRALDAFDTKVADRARVLLEARQIDPAITTLLAFGGAGPMTACAEAEKAGIGRVIVPALSSVFSAFGIGFSDLGHTYDLEADDVARDGLEAAKAAMALRAERDMFGEGVAPDAAEYQFKSWSADGAYAALKPLNGAVADGGRLRLDARHALPKPELAENGDVAAKPVPPAGKAEIKLGPRYGEHTPIVDAGTLQPGHSAEGPLLIRSGYLTCLVPTGWVLSVSSNHDLILEAQS